MNDVRLEIVIPADGIHGALSPNPRVWSDGPLHQLDRLDALVDAELAELRRALVRACLTEWAREEATR